MAKKNEQPKEQPTESKKHIIMVLWKKYVKSLSSSEIAASKERGDVILVPGFKKFLDRTSQAEVLALL